MLSPLQQRVAVIIGGLPEAQDFALAGGAALVVRGEVQRATEDIDFFAPAAESVNRPYLLPRRRLSSKACESNES